MPDETMREGWCLQDEFHYIGTEERPTCPVCGQEIATELIGCECDAPEERIEEALRWHERMKDK